MTFFTIIALHKSGKNCLSLSVVIQIFAFVWLACSLYLIELKKEMSLFVHWSKLLTSKTFVLLSFFVGSRPHELKIILNVDWTFIYKKRIFNHQFKLIFFIFKSIVSIICLVISKSVLPKTISCFRSIIEIPFFFE